MSNLFNLGLLNGNGFISGLGNWNVMITTSISNFPDITASYGIRYPVTNPKTNSPAPFTYNIGNTILCSYIANELSFNDIGNTTISVYQAQTNNYTTSNTIFANLIIKPGTPSFGPFIIEQPIFLYDSSINNSTITIIDPTSPSAGAFTYTSSDPTVAAITSKTITLLKRGFTTITGTQAATRYYNSATFSTGLTIQANPTINSYTLNSVVYLKNGTFTLSNPVSNSVGEFTYISGNTTVATINGNVVSIGNVGNTTISVFEASNNYFTDASFTVNLQITKATPTIIFSITSPIIFLASGNVQLTSSSNSTGAFTYTSGNTSVVSISGSNYIINGAGSTIITAIEASDNNYITYQVSANLLVNKAVPNIGSLSLPTTVYAPSGQITITAPTTNSTGAFTYTSTNTNVVDVSINKLIINGAGTSTITANEASDNNYISGNTSNSIQITKATPTIGTLTIPTTVYSPSGQITITAPTTNSTGAFSYTSGNTNVITVSGNRLIINGVGTTTITATEATDNNYISGSVTTNVQITKATPTIGSFTISAKTYSQGGSFTLVDPSTDSTGAFTYTSGNTSVATISGKTVSYIGAGTTIITATEAADSNYITNYVQTTLTVNKATPTIGTLTIPTTVYSPSGQITITAPTTNSTGAFSYTSGNTNVTTVSGNILIINGAGTTTITATEATDNNYLSGSVTTNLEITQATPTIGSFTISTKTYSQGGSFTLVDPSTNSTGAFTYTSGNTSVATISGKIVSYIGAGTSIITATEASDNNYTTNYVQTTLIINKATPTIGTLTIPTTVYSPSGSITITAPTTNSTGAFSYTSGNTNVTTVSGNILIINGAGTTTITATEATDNNYVSGSVTTNVQITQATPTITFSTPSVLYSPSGTYTLTASSNSTGAFLYTSSNISVATISGSNYIINGAGTTTITATEASDKNYIANQNSSTLVVTKATPTIGTITIPTTVYSPSGQITITAPTTNSTGAFSYTSGNISVVDVSSNKLIINGAGTTTITATEATDNNYLSGSVTTNVQITKATPTIGSFTISTKTYLQGGSFTLVDPSTNSTGAFTYTSGNTSIGTISGKIVSYIGAGTTIITATEASDNNYISYQVSASLQITKATPSISFSIPSVVYNTNGLLIPLTASSISTGGFSFTSGNTSVATISGSNYIIQGAGTSLITVSEASDNNYTANTTTATLTVGKATPIINFSITPVSYSPSGTYALTASSNSTGAFTYTSASSSIAVISGNNYIINKAGSTIITATEAADNNYISYQASANLVVTKVTPTIGTFSIATQPYSASGVVTIIPPTTNSTGAFSYTSGNTSVSTISGGNIIIQGTGTSLITAFELSDNNYNEGTASTTLQVIQGKPNIGSLNISSVVYSPSGIVIINAPTTNSTGAFSYTSSIPSVATISGSSYVIQGAGTTTLTATEASDNNYVSYQVSANLVVTKATPTVLFSIAPVSYSPSGMIELTASGLFNTLTASYYSTGAFSYTSNNPSVATISGSKYIINGVGSATITATEASDNNYVSCSGTAVLNVAKAQPTIVFSTPSVTYSPNGTYALSASGVLNTMTASYYSTGPFTFTSSNTSVASIAYLAKTNASNLVTNGNFNATTIPLIMTDGNNGAQLGYSLFRSDTPYFFDASYNYIYRILSNESYETTTISSWTFYNGFPQTADISGILFPSNLPSYGTTGAYFGCLTGNLQSYSTKQYNNVFNDYTEDGLINLSAALFGIINSNTLYPAYLNNPKYVNLSLNLLPGNTNYGTLSTNFPSNSNILVMDFENMQNSIMNTFSMSQVIPFTSSSIYSFSFSAAMLFSYLGYDFNQTPDLSNNYTTMGIFVTITDGTTSGVGKAGNAVYNKYFNFGGLPFVTFNTFTDTITLRNYNASNTYTMYISVCPNFVETPNNSSINGFIMMTNPTIVPITQTNSFYVIQGTGTTTITASGGEDNNYLSCSGSSILVIQKAIPSITFTIAPVTYTPSGLYSLSAGISSNSTGAFTYTSSNTSIATISGNNYVIQRAGTATITASEASDNNFISYQASATLQIRQATPSITFSVPQVVYNTSGLLNSLTASSNSTGTFTFTSGNTSVATISGSNYIIRGAGSSIITATEASDNNYITYQASATLQITKATPNVGSLVIPTKTFIQGNTFAITAPTTNSTGAFTYTSGNTIVATISGGNIIMANVGTTIITATQATDNNYITYSVSGTFQITQAIPTIGTLNIPAKSYSPGGTFNITDPSTNSTGGFTYISGNTSVATISGKTVTILSAGTTIITATEAADNNYISYQLSGNLLINKIAPTITFSISPVTYSPSGTYTLTSSSNSTGGFTYSSSNPSIATISGSNYVIQKAGTTTIIATEASDNNYTTNTASATLQITQATPNITFSIPSVTYSPSGLISLTASSTSTGGFTYSSSNTSVATISGSNYIIQGAGNSLITATEASDNNYITYDVFSILQIGKATPTINFSMTPVTYSPSGIYALSASSNSKGAFTYTSSNTSVATISGSNYIIQRVGTTTITATEAADNNYISYQASANLVINQIAPTLGTFSIATQPYSASGVVTIIPPTTNSTGAFSYTSGNTSVATISGGNIIIKGTGTSLITAFELSDNNYGEGTTSTTLQVIQGKPNIGSLNISSVVYSPSGIVIITAPTTNSTGAFTYTSSIPSVATISGSSYIIQGAGTTTLTATEASDNNYVSYQVSANLIVTKATPSITFTIAPVTYTPSGLYSLSAGISSNSTGAFTYSSNNTSVATVSGNSYVIQGAGTTTITATEASDNNYISYQASAALQINQSIPSITFSIASVSYSPSASYVLSASSNSTGSFTYSSSNNTVASISGNLYYVNGAGKTIITATEASDNNYISYQASANLIITPAIPQLLFSVLSAPYAAAGAGFVAGYYVYLNGTLYGSFPLTNSINLTGLTPNTQYSVTIAAYNIYGISQQSTAYTFTTAPDLTTGYTNYFKFNSTDFNSSTFSFYDYGKNINNGTGSGTVSLDTTNIFNTKFTSGSLNLNNNNYYYYSIPTNDLNTSNYSFCMWMKNTSNPGYANNDCLISFRDTNTATNTARRNDATTNPNSIDFFYQYHSLYVETWKSSTSTVGYLGSFYNLINIPISYNTWFHIGVTYSQGITKLYLNGNYYSSVSGTNNNFNINYIILGGKYTVRSYIDEFILYNTTLSETDMSNNYNYYVKQL